MDSTESWILLMAIVGLCLFLVATLVINQKAEDKLRRELDHLRRLHADLETRLKELEIRQI